MPPCSKAFCWIDSPQPIISAWQLNPSTTSCHPPHVISQSNQQAVKTPVQEAAIFGRSYSRLSHGGSNNSALLGTYANTHHSGEMLHAGVEAKAYHAGLRDTVRGKVLKDWSAGEVPVVVATVAFGMGIDRASGFLRAACGSLTCRSMVVCSQQCTFAHGCVLFHCDTYCSAFVADLRTGCTGLICGTLRRC